MIFEKHIYIIGSSGFAKTIFQMLTKTERYRNRELSFAGYIDDRLESNPKKYLFNPNDVDFCDTENLFLFGVNSKLFQEEFIKKYKLSADRFQQLTPNVKNVKDAKIGSSIILESFLSPGVEIGNFSFIDSNTTIGHDVKIGDFVHIGVGVIISGNVNIQPNVTIHSGAIIGNNVVIGKGSEIGVGCVVTRNVPENSILVAPKPHVLK